MGASSSSSSASASASASAGPLAFLHTFTASLGRGAPVAALYLALPEAERAVFQRACGLVAAGAAPPAQGLKRRRAEEEEAEGEGEG